MLAPPTTTTSNAGARATAVIHRSVTKIGILRGETTRRERAIGALALSRGRAGARSSARMSRPRLPSPSPGTRNEALVENARADVLL
jgi:hypothetical protein